MPYLSVRTSTPLSADKKTALMKDLSGLICVIPGKTPDNCMIDIDGGCDIFMRGGLIQGAFVDLRLFTHAPDDAKEEFLAGLCKILKERCDVDKQNIYCNMIELSQWGSGDRLSKA